MKVWHLEEQSWVVYKKWMRWCPYINTKGIKHE